MIDINDLRAKYNDYLWEQDISRLPGWHRSFITLLRIFSAVLRDIAGGLPTLRAMSLVYTTLLSLVPLLAVSFSVLKGFGVHNQVEPLLLQFLAPLGDKGVEITEQIIGFVDNIKVGVLGSLGLAMLLYTVVSLIKKIESAFNYTWRIKSFRSLSESFTNYLSIIMIGPLLVFTAIGMTASISHSTVIDTISSIEPFGSLLAWFSKLLPYLLIILAFALIYKLIPNTRVRVRSALYGAVVAGILWESTGFLFATFVANSTNYTAVYSGFAILIVFMIWLYLSWLILLTGSTIAYYHQNPERIRYRDQSIRLSARMREHLALLSMQRIASNFHHHEKPETLDQLSQKLGVPCDALSRVLDALETDRLVMRGGDNCGAYLPASSIENIRVLDILDSARHADEEGGMHPKLVRPCELVDETAKQIDEAIKQQLGDISLKQLIDVKPT